MTSRFTDMASCVTARADGSLRRRGLLSGRACSRRAKVRRGWQRAGQKEAEPCLRSNAVLLVQHHEQTTLQEAVDQVNDMLTNCAQRMTDAATDLRTRY